MKKKIITSCIMILVIILSSCGSSTQITASWVDPEAATAAPGQQNKSVLIASLSRNMEVRTKFEDALAAEAEKRGIRAIKSTTHFPPDFYEKTPSRDEIISGIGKAGVDAILTVSLVDKTSETRYVPGSARYAPFNTYRWYGGFYSYYNYWRPYLYDPGYYVTDKSYFLETNLYDAKTEKLLWSAQSETINPSSINSFAKEYPRVLVKQMIKDGLLKK